MKINEIIKYILNTLQPKLNPHKAGDIMKLYSSNESNIIQNGLNHNMYEFPFYYDAGEDGYGLYLEYDITNSRMIYYDLL